MPYHSLSIGEQLLYQLHLCALLGECTLSDMTVQSMIEYGAMMQQEAYKQDRPGDLYAHQGQTACT